MASYIFDDNGSCVARIVEDKVLSEATGAHIANVRNGTLYATDGTLLGHLQSAGALQEAGSSAPPAFMKLLAERAAGR